MCCNCTSMCCSAYFFLFLTQSGTIFTCVSPVTPPQRTKIASDAVASEAIYHTYPIVSGLQQARRGRRYRRLSPGTMLPRMPLSAAVEASNHNGTGLILVGKDRCAATVRAGRAGRWSLAAGAWAVCTGLA